MHIIQLSWYDVVNVKTIYIFFLFLSICHGWKNTIFTQIQDKEAPPYLTWRGGGGSLGFEHKVVEGAVSFWLQPQHHPQLLLCVYHFYSPWLHPSTISPPPLLPSPASLLTLALAPALTLSGLGHNACACSGSVTVLAAAAALAGAQARAATTTAAMELRKGSVGRDWWEGGQVPGSAGMREWGLNSVSSWI